MGDHWYNDKGEPCHTSVGAKGQEVKTTLTQARKRGLLPSVTTVLSILAKPELDRWKHKQITTACYENPSIQQGQYKWTPEAYNAEMLKKAFETVSDAADLGTLIHDALEKHFKGEEYECRKEVTLGDKTTNLETIAGQVEAWAYDNDVKIEEPELRLADVENGFAGLTDAVIAVKDQRGILDFKTRRFDDTKIKPYSEHPTQIAAYHMAKYGEILDTDIGCNLYISTTKVGLIHPVWYGADELRKHWEKFKHCLGLWVILKNYNPAKK